MTVSPPQAQAHDIGSFLRIFFGPDNSIALQHFEPGGQWAEKRFLLSRLDAGPLPTLLPRRKPTSPDCLELYALAFSRPDFHVLREELMAFMGPTYTDFTGRPSVPRAGDPIDAAVHDITDGKWFLLRLQAERVSKIAGPDRRRWPTNLLLSQWQHSSERRRLDPRGLPWILRDFRLALQAKDGAQADACLSDLRRGNLLDAVNLLFLEIEMLDALDRHEELLKHDALNDLLNLDKPPAVVACLLRAIYAAHLAVFEEREDVAGALARFSTSILPVYGGLLSRSVRTHKPEALLLLAISAVAKGATVDEFDALLPSGSIPPERMPFLDRLRALVATPGPIKANLSDTDQPSQSEMQGSDASLLLSQGDYEGAFLVATDLPPSLDRAWILCQCADALLDLSVDRDAWNALQALLEDDRIVLEQRPAVRHLLGRVGKAHAPPESWTDWFTRLDEGVDQGQYLSLAKRGQDEWPTDPVLANADNTAALRSLILQGPTSACEPLFYAAIPLVIGWARRHPGFPSSIDSGLLLALASAIAMSTQGRQSDLEVVHDLLDGALVNSAAESDYPTAIDIAADTIGAFGAADRLDWTLDLVDTVARRTAPRFGKQGVIRILDEATRRIVAASRYATPTHWQLLEALHKEWSHLEAFEQLKFLRVSESAAGSQDPLATLGHSTIAIYSLDQAQAARAKQLIEQRARDCKVSLLHDLANSIRLTQYARTSDLLVMVTRCATHAATGAIQSARRDKPLLLPHGRGAASILRCIEEHLLAE